MTQSFPTNPTIERQNVLSCWAFNGSINVFRNCQCHYNLDMHGRCQQLIGAVLLLHSSNEP